MGGCVNIGNRTIHFTITGGQGFSVGSVGELMRYFYSAIKNSFYLDVSKSEYEKSGDWPVDVTEVAENIFSEYAGTPPEGKLRVVGADGFPAWGDIPPPTKKDLIAVAENERQQLLTYADNIMQDWRTELMLGEISDTNRAKLSAWLAYKNEVKSADVTADPEHVIWPAPPEA